MTLAYFAPKARPVYDPSNGYVHCPFGLILGSEFWDDPIKSPEIARQFKRLLNQGRPRGLTTEEFNRLCIKRMLVNEGGFTASKMLGLFGTKSPKTSQTAA